VQQTGLVKGQDPVAMMVGTRARDTRAERRVGSCILLLEAIVQFGVRKDDCGLNYGL